MTIFFILLSAASFKFIQCFVGLEVYTLLSNMQVQSILLRRPRRPMRLDPYFFLAGLPRSGNTLLSSILNQNPEIMVSANSFLCDHMHHTALLQYDERFKNFPDSNSLNNLISSTFDSYYKDWDAKYIIDRSSWGTVLAVTA